jgi:hypothetical protein
MCPLVINHMSMLTSIYLTSQILMDYNDLRKLPFYDIIDKELNKDNVKLRCSSHMLVI